MEKGCAERLTENLEQITFEKMPKEVSEKALECLADFWGILYGGSRKPLSKKMTFAWKEKGNAGAEDLAMWMAAAARTLDLDDGHRYAMAHPGVVIHGTAAALAVTQKTRKISGKELITAIVKGYEAYCWQGRLINPGAYLKRGIDATCACGAGAAAVTASSLWGLDREQTQDALSLAASVAGGLNQSAIDGSAQKYLVAGFGAKIGIAAAELAKYGLGGPAHVFEGKLGFANAFTPEPNEEIMNDVSVRWDIQYIYLKIHGCVRRIHATLDAVKAILKEHGLAETDVEQIEVFGGPFLCDAGVYDPKDTAQAQTSIPYTVALLLKFGSVTDTLVEEKLGDPEIGRLMRKISVHLDDRIAEMGKKDKSLWGAARVRIKSSSGQIFEMEKLIPDGERESPFPREVIKEKFLKNSIPVLGRKKAEKTWSNLNGLAGKEDVGAVFTEMLTEIEDYRERIAPALQRQAEEEVC